MITIQVINVIREADTSYTATLQFADDIDNKIIKTTQVNAYTKEQFKDKIREFKEKIGERQTRKSNLLVIVQEAIDEVMAE